MGRLCVYVNSNKKKFSTDLKKSFFPRKVCTQGVTWAILEVSNTTPSCRKDSIAKIYRLISTKMDPRSHISNNKKFRTQRRAAGNPINRRKRVFLDFRDRFTNICTTVLKTCLLLKI